MNISDFSGKIFDKDKRLFFHRGSRIVTPEGVLQNATDAVIAVRANNMTITSLLQDGLVFEEKR